MMNDVTLTLPLGHQICCPVPSLINSDDLYVLFCYRLLSNLPSTLKILQSGAKDLWCHGAWIHLLVPESPSSLLILFLNGFVRSHHLQALTFSSPVVFHYHKTKSALPIALASVYFSRRPDHL